MPTEQNESKQYASPIWLNNQFLEKHLQKYFQDKNLKVNDFRSRPAIAKGENFVSSLHRLSVILNKAPGNHQSTKLSIVAKETLCDEYTFNTLSGLNALDKEIDFYDRIAPKINELLHKLNETDSMLPEIYGICKAQNIILFEDLLITNYSTLPVRKGYDINSAKVIFKKAAAFHAINAVLQQNEPNIFENYRDGLFGQTADGFNQHFLTQLDVVIEVISKWPEFAGYVGKLKRLHGNLVEKARQTFAADPKHFNTLIHGDMWATNCMLKFSDENKSKIENVIFIDFQFSCWTSPTIDLHYFFSTTLQDPLRPDHFEELIAFYHGNLVKYLNDLNYRDHIPTLQEFKQQFLDKALWGFIGMCLTQPIQINDYAEPVNFEDLFSGNKKSMEVKRQMYSTTKIQAILRKYIPYYDRLGVFD